MPYIEATFLALIQGFTEFLPISSSGHLILIPHFFGWQDQGLAFDVAVHVGTLLAVIGYFRDDILAIFNGWLGSLSGRGLTPSGQLAWYIILSTIPVGLVGLLANNWIEAHLRGPLIIAMATIGFGLVLGFADFYGKAKHDLLTMNWQAALYIGCAQALALIPGTSRSGITLSAALLLGFHRKAAARYAFLLAIPTIFLAGALESLKLLDHSQSIEPMVMLYAMVVSMLSAWLCIHWFMKLIDSIGMLPFVIYRCALGLLIIALL